MDSPEGALVGTVNVEATGSEDTFKEFSCKLDRITDTHNVFLVFKGKAENLMNVDYYSFGEYQVNTEALSSKIAEAERLLSSLTGSAKTDLEKAIAEAKALLEKADADQGKIDNAFDSLSKAYNTAKATISDGGKKDDDTKKPDGNTQKPTNGSTAGNTKKPANGGTAGNTKTPSKDSMQSYVGKTFTIGKKLTYKVTACSKKVKTVTVIGSKKQLKSITIPATVTYQKMKFKVTEISKNAFKKQKKLTKVTIGKNVTKIGANAFYGDKKLSKVTIKGKKLKKIGKNAFKKIKKSATFKVPKGKAKAYKNMLKKAKTSSYKVK